MTVKKMLVLSRPIIHSGYDDRREFIILHHIRPVWFVFHHPIIPQAAKRCQLFAIIGLAVKIAYGGRNEAAATRLNNGRGCWRRCDENRSWRRRWRRRRWRYNRYRFDKVPTHGGMYWRTRCRIHRLRCIEC